jgi:hypothetical protein
VGTAAARRRRRQRGAERGEEGEREMGREHGPNNYKDTKISMSSLLNRVYRLEIQLVMLVFSTPLVN